MRLWLSVCVCLILGLGWSIEVNAKTLVLIHGFQGKGMDWRLQQVTQGLQATGWVDGGHYQPTTQGLYNPVRLPKRPVDVFYTLDLPSTQRVDIQAQWLTRYLQTIYQQRNEPLELVAHSAGGVVARYWLVVLQNLPVNTLLTIAAPHVGTPVADMVSVLMATPLGRMADEAGLRAFYRESQPLLEQLAEERPQNFMYWLNHQPHPTLRYVSVVRDNQRPDQFDFIVPFFSQNMNHVYALHQRSEVWTSQGNHFLQRRDGWVINQILRSY